MSTTTKKKPHTVTRWTDEEVAELYEIIGSARTATEGFEQASKKLGRKPGTIQQKYYQLEKNKRKPAKRVKRASVASVTPRVTAKKPTLIDVSTLSNEQIGELAASVMIEVRKRQEELAKTVSLFNA